MHFLFADFLFLRVLILNSTWIIFTCRIFLNPDKATQTQLLVSRLLPAKRGCGRAVIIHYFIITCIMTQCTEQTRDVI